MAQCVVPCAAAGPHVVPYSALLSRAALGRLWPGPQGVCHKAQASTLGVGICRDALGQTEMGMPLCVIAYVYIYIYIFMHIYIYIHI